DGHVHSNGRVAVKIQLETTSANMRRKHETQLVCRSLVGGVNASEQCSSDLHVVSRQRLAALAAKLNGLFVPEKQPPTAKTTQRRSGKPGRKHLALSSCPHNPFDEPHRLGKNVRFEAQLSANQHNVLESSDGTP